jgi:hypothetical protein
MLGLKFKQHNISSLNNRVTRPSTWGIRVNAFKWVMKNVIGQECCKNIYSFRKGSYKSRMAARSIKGVVFLYALHKHQCSYHIILSCSTTSVKLTGGTE